MALSVDMEAHDSIMRGLMDDGFPNSAEILLVYGPNALEAILNYEKSMKLIAEAQASGIKVGRIPGSSFLEWSRSLAEQSFDKVAEQLERTHGLDKGLFATLFTFAYGCEPLTDHEAAKLGITL